MQPNEWVTTGLAVIAIIISALAWKAAHRNAKAAEASAQAAIESNELAKRQYEEHHAKERSLWIANRKEFVQRLLNVANQIHTAVLAKYSMEIFNQPLVIDWESIKHVPKEIPFNQQELIEYFEEKERELIKRAWASLQYLFKEYGEDDPDRRGIGYAGTVIGEYNNLMRMLEKQ